MKFFHATLAASFLALALGMSSCIKRENTQTATTAGSVQQPASKASSLMLGETSATSMPGEPGGMPGEPGTPAATGQPGAPGQPGGAPVPPEVAPLPVPAGPLKVKPGNQEELEVKMTSHGVYELPMPTPGPGGGGASDGSYCKVTIAGGKITVEGGRSSNSEKYSGEANYTGLPVTIKGTFSPGVARPAQAMDIVVK